MELYETEKLLCKKGNSHQTEETAHRMGKIFFTYTSDIGLMMRIYRKLKELNSKRINNSKKKWENELKRQFSFF
jgi:hypothetical protein